MEPPAGGDDWKLAEALRRLTATFSPEKIYLFGSRARGDAGQDSDYDLTVIVPDSPLTPYRRHSSPTGRSTGWRSPPT